VAGGLCAAFCEILNLQSLILLQRGGESIVPGIKFIKRARVSRARFVFVGENRLSSERPIN